mmetsp:Transcript_73228/g.203118  ORF Transcript_73228/g.203118 Transcript_73228/m.203118 type:complete len:272 (+) Transcript_73228:2010-2825(+)
MSKLLARKTRASCSTDKRPLPASSKRSAANFMRSTVFAFVKPANATSNKRKSQCTWPPSPLVMASSPKRWPAIVWSMPNTSENSSRESIWSVMGLPCLFRSSLNRATHLCTSEVLMCWRFPNTSRQAPLTTAACPPPPLELPTWSPSELVLLTAAAAASSKPTDDALASFDTDSQIDGASDGVFAAPDGAAGAEGGRGDPRFRICGDGVVVGGDACGSSGFATSTRRRGGGSSTSFAGEPTGAPTGAKAAGGPILSAALSRGVAGRNGKRL